MEGRRHDSPQRLAVVGAAVWTLDDVVPTATAFLIEDGRIAAVGDQDAVLRRAGGDADVLDCGGASIVPGFVDGHCHFELTCITMDRWLGVHTPPFETLEDIAQAIARRLDRDADGDWLLCRTSFAAHEKVREGRLFTREELDRLAPERPLAVFASLHVASLNTAALRRLGLYDVGSPHPFHGVVHRDGRGDPTGVVTEVFMMVPSPGDDAAFDDSVTRHGRELFSAGGTTTVLTMPENLHQVDLQRALHERRELTVRQRYYLISPGVADLAEASELRARERATDRFSFGGIKVFVNGCGHDGLGEPLEDAKWTQDELSTFVTEAERLGMQVWLHSLTAEGVRTAARAVLAAGGGVNRLRHRIEHGGDFLDVADLPLVASSGALMVTTPQFLHSMSADVTGPRAPARTILGSGVPLLGGTDSTGTVPSSVSILGNVATAVNRRRTDGSVFHGDEALTVEQALRLFTTASSYGGMLDHDRGTISLGKLADFVVLSEDLRSIDVERIGEVAVVSTYVGGECVWQP